MDITHKKIGIWGFGITGKSIARYAQEHHCIIQVMDKEIPPTEHSLQKSPISFCTEDSREQFFSDNAFIMPSPGIDLRPYIARIKDKLVCELDFFQAQAQKPIIAITGTVGKTTITTLISVLLAKYQKKILTGGNIGVPMLSLLSQQHDNDYFVLETSDAQLKHTTTFAPELAIFTNFSANHLDWHGSEKDYFAAKNKIISHQTDNQHALIPRDLFARLKSSAPRATLHLFQNMPPDAAQCALLKRNQKLFFIKDHSIFVYENDTTHELVAIKDLPTITFSDNWLIIVAALYLIQGHVTELAQKSSLLKPLAHRVEKVATYISIDFYNDSKATTITSTMAAVQSLLQRPIILLLGGLSKGVDRTPLVTWLKGRVKMVVCFGKEHATLYEQCQLHQIPAYASTTLEEAFAQCTSAMAKNDIVLLSPSGSSFDLFKDYQERGNRFCTLVQDFINHSQ